MKCLIWLDITIEEKSIWDFVPASFQFLNACEADWIHNSRYDSRFSNNHFLFLLCFSCLLILEPKLEPVHIPLTIVRYPYQFSLNIFPRRLCGNQTAKLPITISPPPRFNLSKRVFPAKSGSEFEPSRIVKIVFFIPLNKALNTAHTSINSVLSALANYAVSVVTTAIFKRTGIAVRRCCDDLGAIRKPEWNFA